jgi:short-subunit dehydrogenase
MPDYSFFDQFGNISLLMITAGFGKLALFEELSEDYIVNSFHVNTVSAIRLIHHFYDKLKGQEDFFCGVMVSIAGFMSSPFFSVYGATKAALKIFIESVNVELEMAGSPNRILNVSPGSIPGTRFNGSDNDLSLTQELAQEIISHMVAKDDLFIPKYEEVYREVLARYQKDFRAEGRHSYEYKLKSGRLNRK